MGTKGGISLANFCVFNPTYGPREGEVLIFTFITILQLIFIWKNIELNKNKHLYCKYALFYSLKWLSLFLQEHKKIVFFYPKETDIDTQIKHIGLCEAIVRFTEYVTHLNTQNPKLSFIQNKNYFNEHILISIDMLLYITEHFLISHAKVSTQPREDNSSWKQKRISGWLW